MRECSDDEAAGGDEDGEFVVIEDCGAEGICFQELTLGGQPRAEVLSGCITSACAESGVLNCLEIGSSICSGFDSDIVATCQEDAESGCQRFLPGTACSDSGQVCAFENEAASCVAP